MFSKGKSYRKASKIVNLTLDPEYNNIEAFGSNRETHKNRIFYHSEFA